MASIHELHPGKEIGDNRSGTPPGPPDMESRIAKLEAAAEKTHSELAGIKTDVAKLETQLDGFKQEAFRTFATKADVMDAKNSIIMWVVSAILLSQLLPSILKKLWA